MIFGVTVPLASWNPLWANLQVYAGLWNDAWRAASWWDRLRIWFMPTGWRPADVAARYPQAKPDLGNFRKFDVALGRGAQCYALLQFVCYLLAGVWLLAQGESLALAALLLACLWVALGLCSIGLWLENRPGAARLEYLRLLLNVPALWLAGALGALSLDGGAWGWLAAYSLASLLGIWLARGSAAPALTPPV